MMFEELTAPSRGVVSPIEGVTAFVLPALSTRGGRVRPMCAVTPGASGVDATARFVAPVGGRWRLTARGLDLAGLSIARACAEPTACEAFRGLRGAAVTSTRVLDFEAQRGASFSVTVTGCPAGRECSYELRAERIAPLSCPRAWDADAACGMSQVCAIDRCDDQRLVCAPEAASRLERARLALDRARNVGVLTGALRAIAPGSLRRLPLTLMVDWSRADGSLLNRDFIGEARLDGDSFTRESTRFPREAARGRLWIYDSSRTPEASLADGVDISIEGWAPRTESMPCDAADVLARCAEGLRCATSGAATSGTCQRVTVPVITGLRAWRDRTRDALRMRIEGFDAGATVTQAQVALLDGGGAVLATVPPWSVVTTGSNGFTSSYEFLNIPPRVALSEASRVRVTVVDTERRESAAFDAPIVDASPVGVGARCDDPAVRCGAGLVCPSVSGPARCEPSPPPRPCELGVTVPTWAPGTAATASVTGGFEGFGGTTACAGGKGSAIARLEFVAGASGRYEFAATGVTAIESRRACGSPMVVSDCAEGDGAARVTVELTAGDRVPITVLGATSSREYTVTMRRM